MQPGSNMHVQGPQINQFNNISPNPIPRSSFQRDYPLRTTFNQDYLVPIFNDEILPGDDISLKMTAFTRVATPIKPIMDNLYLETFFFFVPNRLVWSNWQKFQGEQINPGDSVAYTIPVLDDTVAPLSTTGFQPQSIFDYLEMPTLVTSLNKISALYNRACELIWNEWFRDENLQNSIPVPLGDGPDNPASYVLRKRNKRKDYFTSALPWPQKGNAVNIPLTGTAPLTTTVAASGAMDWTIGTGSRNQLFQTTPGWTGNTTSGTPQDNVAAQYKSGLQVTGTADLSAASAVTINALRQAALYQQILELDARGGTRYVEAIYSRFGVVSPDFRLQRPELIGQGSTRFNIYAVPQTAPTGDDTTPQGNLAAFGTATVQGHGCRYSATEHGMIIGFANVRADLTYQQGLPRRFSRQTRLDFYEPLQNGLGEQAILRKEIFATGVESEDNSVWGYQGRFDEYRFKGPQITGLFRSSAPQSLDVWHLSQELVNPSLNGLFLQENVPMGRVVATPSEPSFLMDCAFTYLHVRPMPMRSNPGIDIL